MVSVSEQLGPLLGETHRVWKTKLDERLRPLGLSQARWMVLLKLSRQGDGVVQKELAEWLGIEGPTLVRLLDRMSEDGWIERRESRQDRRAKTVHLTRQAHGVITQINNIAAGLRRELFADIDTADLEVAQRVMQHIKQKAERL